MPVRPEPSTEAVAWAMGVSCDVLVELGPHKARERIPVLNGETRRVLLVLAASVAPGAVIAVVEIGAAVAAANVSQGRFQWCLNLLNKGRLISAPSTREIDGVYHLQVTLNIGRWR